MYCLYLRMLPGTYISAMSVEGHVCIRTSSNSPSHTRNMPQTAHRCASSYCTWCLLDGWLYLCHVKITVLSAHCLASHQQVGKRHYNQLWAITAARIWQLSSSSPKRSKEPLVCKSDAAGAKPVLVLLHRANIPNTSLATTQVAAVAAVATMTAAVAAVRGLMVVAVAAL